MICEEKDCGEEFCYYHSNAHQGSSCLSYMWKTRKESAATQSLLSVTSKKCPGCGLRIDKISGCNHMTFFLS